MNCNFKLGFDVVAGILFWTNDAHVVISPTFIEFQKNIFGLCSFMALLKYGSPLIR